MNTVEGGMPTNTDFPLLSRGGVGGSGSQAQSLLLCVMRFAYFFTQPPTVLNPQNYSYFKLSGSLGV